MHAGRDPEHARQTGYLQSRRQLRELLLPDVSGAQEGWQAETTRPVVATLREVGMRMIIYIDDILVMAETESLLKDNISAVVYLLENLGFVVNHPKSELTPTQEI